MHGTVGRACLAARGLAAVEHRAEAGTLEINDALHELSDPRGNVGINHFLTVSDLERDLLAVRVGDLGHRHRGAVDAAGSDSGVGAGHGQWRTVIGTEDVGRGIVPAARAVFVAITAVQSQPGHRVPDIARADLGGQSGESRVH